jgi:hypothetical protein
MIKRKKLQCVLNLLFIASVIYLTGCSGGAYKSSGQYKRDILVDRIEKARQSHERAKTQFQVVLTDYSNVVDAGEDNLHAEYNKLSKQYKKTKAVTKDMYRKIADVEKIGKPLFRDWEDELENYENEKIRRSSEEHLDATRSNYLKVLHAVKNTEYKTASTLKSLNDQMLFLSQNLNARAMKSFKEEIAALKAELKDLAKLMDKAIDEANKFTKTGSVVVATVQE